MIGVLFALVWFGYKNKGTKLDTIPFINKFYSRVLGSKFIRIITMLSGLFLGLTAFFLPYPLFSMDEGTMKQVLSSIFMSIERQVFTFGVVLFLTPPVLGKAGAFRVMLGNRAFVPLARLNTSTLLVHGVILMWYFFGKYQILRIDPSVINMSFIALALLSYISAIFFSISIETPLITLESLLW
mmetsp:Transcript_17984/g.15908  ORF Transcript_17984/g.15908 Transcript_17984/m.15908 type:complete len:184 (+) Transcript_17984:1403-1954(+)